MAQKPETKFRKKLRTELSKLPETWFESIQQMGINGSPDLMGCVAGYFVAIEVKTDEGVSSALQTYKLSEIKKCGGLALVVSPKNLAESLEQIKKLLTK